VTRKRIIPLWACAVEEDVVLFDLPAAAIARQNGIQASDDHANEIWKQEAYRSVKTVAIQYFHLTTDEVWQEMENSSTASTHEPAAMGPVMLRACRDGLIVKTNELVRTKIPRRHRELVVWRSLIYRP
jgi:hypothetical protein